MRRVGGELPEIVASMFDARVVASGDVGGGDSGHAFKVRLATADRPGFTVFVKTHPDPPPGWFTDEAGGLGWLGETNTVRVPEVLAVQDDPELAHHFLVLEWIESGPAAPDHDEGLGRALADLHRFPCARFGLEQDNYVGPLPQLNDPAPTWAEFYAYRRLEPLVQLAVDEDRLPTDVLPRVDALLERLPELVGPPEPPARLHGDLWAGNAVTDDHGRPVLVDPAVYGGHREVDLAMMRLFGGFGPGVFAAYAEAHPLSPGHEERVELYQLYPVLVHVNLFGGTYANRARAILERYS